MSDHFVFSSDRARHSVWRLTYIQKGGIRLGTESITREQVEEAAEQVNLMDFIRSLPEGFEQPIRERGGSLSTGQSN